MKQRLLLLSAILLLVTFTSLIRRIPPTTLAQEGGLCSETLPSRLMIGERGRVLPGPSNNVRAQPTTQSPILGQIPGGGFFLIMDGPVCAEGMAWWQVRYGKLSGWTAEGAAETYWLEPLPRITPENATHLTQFATLGRGGGFIGWLPDQQTLAMTSGGGVLLLNGDRPLDLSPQIDVTLPQSVAISRDWKQIATSRHYLCLSGDLFCSGDYVVRVWDLESGERLHVLEGHTGDVTELSFNPDGTLLRSFSWEDGVLVWDLTTGQRLLSPVGYKHVLEFNLSDQLYVVDDAGYIWLWDVRTGQVAASAPILGPIEDTPLFVFSPNRTRLIIRGWTSSGFEVWDLLNGTSLFASHETYIGVDWGLGWIVTDRQGDTFVIRTLNTGEEIQSFSTNWEEGQVPHFYGTPDEVVFSADHRLMAIRTISDWCIGSLEIWDVASGESLFYWDNGCTSIVFHPETDNLLIDSLEGLFEWDAHEHSLQLLVQDSRIFTEVAFSDNDSLLVAADRDGRIHAWDATNWTELDGTRSYGRPIFAVSPDGQSIAYLGSAKAENSDIVEADYTVRLWNPWAGCDERSFVYENEAWIFALAFDRTGRTLGAVGSKLWLWDAITGQLSTGDDRENNPDLLTTLQQKNLWWQRFPIESVPDTYRFWDIGEAKAPVFSPDGTLLVSLCEAGICLLDAKSGDQIRVMDAVEGDISSAAFSPDGQLLAATAGGYGYETEGRLYVWETASGKLLAAPEGHLGTAWGVAFSPDGTVIASAGGGCYQCESRGWDNVIRLWRVVP